MTSNAKYPRSASFGIGCLHFGINFVKPTKISQDLYFKNLKDTLNKIDALSDLQIMKSPLAESNQNTIEIEEQPLKMEEGGCFPTFSSSIIEFKLFLPRRIQAELLNEEESFVNTGSEHFKVTNLYTYWGPITFVEAIGAPHSTAPGYGVAVVREYLAKNLNQSNYPVLLDFIGPSPLHFHFYISEKNDSVEKPNSLDLKIEKQPGYDSAWIYTRPVKTDSEWESRKIRIFEAMSDEVAFFYKFMRIRAAQMESWQEIENLIAKLINSPETNNLKEKFVIRVKRRSLIKEVFHKISRFRSEIMFSENWQQSDYQHIYVSGKQKTYFKEYVDSWIKGNYKYPTSDALDIIKFEEERAVKKYEFKALIAAAVFGALVTWLTQFLVCTPTIPISI